MSFECELLMMSACTCVGESSDFDDGSIGLIKAQ